MQITFVMFMCKSSPTQLSHASDQVCNVVFEYWPSICLRSSSRKQHVFRNIRTVCFTTCHIIYFSLFCADGSLRSPQAPGSVEHGRDSGQGGRQHVTGWAHGELCVSVWWWRPSPEPTHHGEAETRTVQRDGAGNRLQAHPGSVIAAGGPCQRPHSCPSVPSQHFNREKDTSTQKETQNGRLAEKGQRPPKWFPVDQRCFFQRNAPSAARLTGLDNSDLSPWHGIMLPGPHTGFKTRDVYEW